MVTGTIFQILRFSAFDGPGLRTVVFLKGCTMRCAWCGHPEAMDGRPELAFSPERCVGCGNCYRVCAHASHSMSGDKRHVIDRKACRLCGSCTMQCEGAALSMLGSERTVDEVMETVRQDRRLLLGNRGGVTLSGGEPTSQLEFCLAFLEAAGRMGLHRCLETNGHCEWERLEALLPHVDLFLYNYKESNPDYHQEFTGAGNERVLENLGRLQQHGARLRLRCPLVPGMNVRQGHFRGIASVAAQLPGLEGIELLPYRLADPNEESAPPGQIERLGPAPRYRLREENDSEFREWLWALTAQLRERRLSPELLINPLRGNA